MRVAICNQEKGVSNEIERHILTMYPNIKICRLTDKKELLSCSELYDIVYLDMQMAGMDDDGMKTRIREKQPLAFIILMDSEQEAEWGGFDERVRHLIKPFDKVDFFQTLRIAVETVRAGENNFSGEERTIMVKEGMESRNINISEIVYLQITNRKITLHLRDEIVEFYGKLGDYEEVLGKDFYRTHRTYLIHLKYVRQFNNSFVTMENGEEVPLVKQKYGDFLNCYRQYTESME